MEKGHEAIVRGRNLPISTKFSVEICSFIRGKPLAVAKKQLDDVVNLKMAVPFKRYTWDLSHRKGKVGPGRYPVKAADAIGKLLSSVKSNADDLGLDTKNLEIYSAVANQGPGTWHAGRKRRRQVKSTHIEIRVKEIEIKK